MRCACEPHARAQLSLEAVHRPQRRKTGGGRFSRDGRGRLSPCADRTGSAHARSGFDMPNAALTLSSPCPAGDSERVRLRSERVASPERRGSTGSRRCQPRPGGVTRPREPRSFDAPSRGGFTANWQRVASGWTTSVPVQEFLIGPREVNDSHGQSRDYNCTPVNPPWLACSRNAAAHERSGSDQRREYDRNTVGKRGRRRAHQIRTTANACVETGRVLERAYSHIPNFKYGIADCGVLSGVVRLHLWQRFAQSEH